MKIDEDEKERKLKDDAIARERGKKNNLQLKARCCKRGKKKLVSLRLKFVAERRYICERESVCGYVCVCL